MTPKIFTGMAALVCAVVLASGVTVKAQGVGGYGIGPWPYSYDQSGQSEPYGYAVPPDASWCAQRYRSFDPATGTYLGYDGRRHICQAPVADQGSAFGYAPQPYPQAAPPVWGYGGGRRAPLYTPYGNVRDRQTYELGY
jgi:hypothetical protein